MIDIFELQRRAQVLSQKHLVGSITPQEVGGLIADTLAFIASQEQNLASLGIVKVYQNYDAMVADVVKPMIGDVPLRFGQLASIYNSQNADDVHNGDIYSWQGGVWRFIGNINKVAIGTGQGQAFSGTRGKELEDALTQEIQTRAEAINSVNRSIDENEEEFNQYCQFTDEQIERNISETNKRFTKLENDILNNSQEIDSIKERDIYEKINEEIKPIKTHIDELETKIFKKKVVSETEYEELQKRGAIQNDVFYFVTE